MARRRLQLIQGAIENRFVIAPGAVFPHFPHRNEKDSEFAQHGMPLQEKRDQKRDAHFTAAGFRILRFWNTDINNELAGVIDKILATLAIPPSGPADRLPRKGGE